MEKIPVVIPSHKRPNRVLTLKAVADCIICVPASQAAQYRDSNPDTEILEHPDSVIGLLPKRQWILEHFGGEVFQIDDDIKKVSRVHVEPGEVDKLTPREAADLIQATADAARQAGVKVFTFGECNKPNYFSPLEPIRMTGFIPGHAYGILNGSKLWYNYDIKCHCDFWISALNAYYHRWAWIDDRFYFDHEIWTSRGGQAEFRTNVSIEEDVKLLRKIFGTNIFPERMTKNKVHDHPVTFKSPF